MEKETPKSIEEKYDEIVEFIIEQGKASASLLQRRFRFGYNRAAMCIDLLEENGIVGPQIGSRPREVLVTNTNYDRINDYIVKKTTEEYKNEIEREKTYEEIISMLKEEYKIITEFDKTYVFSEIEKPILIFI